MTTTKITRTVFCNVKEGNLIFQSTPYSYLDWQEVPDTRVETGSYYQADLQAKVSENLIPQILQNYNCWVEGQNEPLSHPVFFRHFYKRFHSSFRLHRRLGELENFDKDSYPVLGDDYRWEWAKYFSAHCFGHSLEN